MIDWLMQNIPHFVALCEKPVAIAASQASSCINDESIYEPVNRWIVKPASTQQFHSFARGACVKDAMRECYFCGENYFSRFVLSRNSSLR